MKKDNVSVSFPGVLRSLSSQEEAPTMFTVLSNVQLTILL